MATPDSPNPLLVLWDVDGTLINNGGVSKMAYARGFELLTGRTPTEPVITQGQTDPAIIRSLLERHGMPVTADLMDRVPEVMPEALDSLAGVLAERGRPLPGAAQVIGALAREPGVIQSLLTGNVAANGRTKVVTFGYGPGLDFAVGGYGSDHEVRFELVGAALRKVAAKYGIDIPPQRVVLVGDTPRDVEAGLLSGAYVVAVATGEHHMAELAAEGAHVVLPDLADVDLAVAAILSARDR